MEGRKILVIFLASLFFFCSSSYWVPIISHKTVAFNEEEQTLILTKWPKNKTNLELKFTVYLDRIANRETKMK